ncbi:MAG: hypothetical protein H7210_03380, partial [Pyrinomonadaceae bacterium]|nr:hypothetical protein [Phycisphaerales bacterium]
GTLGGTGTILFSTDFDHNLAIDGNTTLTIASGITVRGNRGTIGIAVFTGGNNVLINQGTIRADAANPSGINIIADSTTNTGTIGAITGGTLTIGGAWSNAGGTLLVNAAILNLGGTFQMTGVGAFNRTAGTVNLTGTVTGGAGDTLNLNASTGTWVMNGGHISGGTVTMSGGAGLTVTTNSNNRLSGVTVNGNIDLAITSATLRVAGGFTLNGTVTVSGNSANLVFDSTGTLGGSGTILFSGEFDHNLGIDGNTTLTVGPGITIRGNRGTIGIAVFTGGNNALINQGAIISDTSNLTGININADVFTNQGTIVARTSGKLTITPAVGTPVALTNSGTIVVGSLGVIRVNGNFVQTAAGTFRVEISGIAQPHVGKLVITGTAALDGTFATVGVPGFFSTCMNVEVLTAATVNGQFTLNDFVSPPIGFQSIAVYPPNTDTVRFAISQLSDWNEDGLLNSQDFFDFIASFFAQSPEADFNNDGFINSQDLFDFVSSFFTPCP